MHSAVLHDSVMMDTLRSSIAEVDGWEFGFLLGRVFIDDNANGGWDVGEPFVKSSNSCASGTEVAGVEPRWGGPISSSGALEFCNPDPYYHSGPIRTGTYVADVSRPAGWTAAAIPSALVDVRPEGTHVWFALRRPASLSGFILGRLFVDHDADGWWDPGEPFVVAANTCTRGTVIAGVTITWRGPADGDSAARFCNPDPFYHTGPIPLGTYSLNVTLPTGWQAIAFPSATVSARSEGTHVWFALRPPPPRGSMLGRLFIDENLNGTWELGEAFVSAPSTCSHGVAMANVSVSWSGPVAGDGLPQFCNPDPFFHSGLIPPGSYAVTVACLLDGPCTRWRRRRSTWGQESRTSGSRYDGRPRRRPVSSSGGYSLTRTAVERGMSARGSSQLRQPVAPVLF